MARQASVNLDDVELDGDGEGGADPLDQEIDFEKVKGTKLLPDGEYHFRVEGADAKMSKQELPKGVFRCIVLDGEEEGVTSFFDLSFAPGAQGRTKQLLVGMGMPETVKWTPRQVCAEARGWEFYAVLTAEQSDRINKATQKAYDPRNKLVSTSQERQYDEVE